MRELTEAMTSVNCRQMDAVLRRTEQGPLCDADLSWLRETPRLRPVDEIKAAFRAQGWPSRLLSALLAAVRARCEAELGHVVPDMWRKGFGYSLVFSSSPRGKSGEMRIMPSVYLGPGPSRCGDTQAYRLPSGRYTRIERFMRFEHTYRSGKAAGRRFTSVPALWTLRNASPAFYP